MASAPIYRMKRTLVHGSSKGEKDGDAGVHTFVDINVPDVLEPGDFLEVTISCLRADGAIVRDATTRLEVDPRGALVVLSDNQ